jgi:small subunit ribosomal protein S9
MSTFQYSDLISVLERLVEHPYSYRLKDFIDKFRKPLLNQTNILDIPKVRLIQLLFYFIHNPEIN